MSSLAAAVGAPAPVTIGNQTYTASPVQLFDLGALEETVRAAIIGNAELAARNLPPAMREGVRDHAMRKALSLSYYSPEFSAYLGSFAGTCRLIAHSLRVMHKDIDEAFVLRTLAKDAAQFGAAADTVMRISGLDGESPDGKGEGGASGEATGGESGASS